MRRYTSRSGGFLTFALAGLAAAAYSYTQGAHAADASAPTDTLEAIVVTAERRSESIQDVPVSVTAISGATLEEFDLQNFADYAGTIPNLAWNTGSDLGITSGLNITIRGVVGGRARDEQNTTSYYIDDTPVPLSIDPRVLDLQRIEVLRGPQGALFGSSAMGGTIRLITRQADAERSYGTIDVQGFDINHGGPGYDLNGTYNLPLIQDELALKVSAFSDYKPGYFTREYGIATSPGYTILPSQPEGEVTHIASDTEFGGMVTLTYTPSAIPGLSVTPRAIYQSARSNGFPLADYTPNNLTQVRPLDVGESWRDRWSFFSLTEKYQTGFGTFYASSGWLHRIGFDQEDGTEATSTQVGQYATPPLSTILASHYLPAPIPGYIYYLTTTQELRFESSIPGPVQFIAGGYYNHSYSEVNYPDLQPYESLTTPYEPNGEFFYNEIIPNHFNEVAEFADITYTPITALQLSAGARDAILGYNQVNFAEGWINGGTSLTRTTHEEHPVTPRYTAKYNLTQDAMVYASAAKGYRIGGQNGPLPFFCAGEGVSGGNYFSDSLWSYEVGSKNTLFDGRMNTRAAAYRIDWMNIQQTVLLPCGYTQVQNAGAATSTGGEFEADMVPMHGLTLNMGLGFDNAKITSAPAGGNFFVGQRLSNVPKWTASLLGDYTVPTSYGNSFIRAKYTFAGNSISYNNAPNPTPGRERGSYSLVDLIAGLQQGPWEMSLVAKNVFDRRANLGDEQPLSGELADRPRWLIAQPRTVGFQIIRRFKGQ